MCDDVTECADHVAQRKLVLNYLCHYSFVDTAKAFAKSVPYEDGKDEEVVNLTDSQIRDVELRKGEQAFQMRGIRN